jgi:hypothetical protein
MLTGSMGGRLICALTLGVALVALSVVPALATPTGLNNIPTADVVAKDFLVLQSWLGFGSGLDTSWAAGAKYGPAENWEVGLDGGLTGPGSGGGPVFQAKYRVCLEKGARIALGAANVSNDRDLHGDYFPYVVASVPIGSQADGHLGYSFQSGNNGLFLGANAAVSPRLTLRSDWIQTDSGDESVWSLGFISPVTSDFLVEGWASFPTAEGSETDYILKVDYVIPLRT